MNYFKFTQKSRFVYSTCIGHVLGCQFFAFAGKSFAHPKMDCS